MNIEIITIGGEILKGAIVDTNFTYLSRRLNEKGWRVSRHMSVEDDEALITLVCREALVRADVVLVTGGLGPTLDDKTKQALSKLFHKKCMLNKKIRDELIQRYGDKLDSLDEQSTVPEGVDLLKNRLGTAPGFIFREKEKNMYVMPGVPLEMQQMFEEGVVPDIEKNDKTLLKVVSRQWHFCHLVELAFDPWLREIKKRYKGLQVGIYPGYGVVSVEMSIASSLEEGEKVLNECEELLLKNFGTYFFSKTNKCIAEAIQKQMIQEGKTLVLAESCTGGHIAAKLVDIPGASQYFLGSIVCYSDLLKASCLGVAKEILKEKGAVSEEAAFQMVQGALNLSLADYALAVSGVAGPDGGSSEKPVGTVWCGLGIKGQKPFVWKILAKGRGKRESVIEYSANFILGTLWRYSAYQINPL